MIKIPISNPQPRANAFYIRILYNGLVGKGNSCDLIQLKILNFMY